PPTPGLHALSLHDALPISTQGFDLFHETLFQHRPKSLSDAVMQNLTLRWCDSKLDNSIGQLPTARRARIRISCCLAPTMLGHAHDRKSTRLTSSHVKSSYA